MEKWIGMLRNLWYGVQVPVRHVVVNMDDLVSLPAVDPTYADLPVLPFDKIEFFLEYTKHHRPEVYAYMLSRLQIAITEELDSIGLYTLNQTKKTVRVSQENYIPQLLVLQQYFTDNEQYELANQCLVLRDQHKINQLLH